MSEAISLGSLALAPPHSLELLQPKIPPGSTHSSTLAITELADSNITKPDITIPSLPTYPPPLPVLPLGPPTITIPATNESFASLFTRASDTLGSGAINRARFDPLATIRPKSSSVDMRCSTVSVNGTFDQIPLVNPAADRFSGFVEDYRLIPSNYATLPANSLYIPPHPFTKQQKLRSTKARTITIPRTSIVSSYYPPQYFGIRRAYIVNPSVVARRHVRRGIRVIFDGVEGIDVNYYVNRVRQFRGDVADVELIAFTTDGQSHPETSLSWPPIIIEFPATSVLMTPEKPADIGGRGSEFQQEEEEELFGAFLPCDSTLFSLFFHLRNLWN